jgi:hypothetical protein
MSEPSKCIIGNDAGVERCFGCKNRTTLHEAVVIEGGLLCCRRCADRRTVVSSKTSPSWSVEIIG